jgi:hypothetical protein
MTIFRTTASDLMVIISLEISHKIFTIASPNSYIKRIMIIASLGINFPRYMKPLSSLCALSSNFGCSDLENFLSHFSSMLRCQSLMSLFLQGFKALGALLVTLELFHLTFLTFTKIPRTTRPMHSLCGSMFSLHCYYQRFNAISPDLF